MTARWLERLYRLVLAFYPRRLRAEYGSDMKLVLDDLMEDPEMSRWHVFTSLLGDLANRIVDGMRSGVVFGLAVVLIWLANRSVDLGPLDPNPMLGVSLMALLFAGAGYVGAKRYRGLRGGIVVGLVAGIVAATTIPGDAILFGNYINPRTEPVSFVLTMLIAVAIVMFFVTAGALVADFSKLAMRMRRGANAFADAWSDPELTP